MGKKFIYLPKCRTFYKPSEDEIKSFSLDGSYIHLPNPTIDNITVNNISNVEFDYTESLIDDGEDVLPDDNIEGDKK